MGKSECNIKKHLGILFTKYNGGTKEVNIISWYWGPSVYDIRKWSPKHQPSKKGITLSEKEARTLYAVLKEIFEKG